MARTLWIVTLAGLLASSGCGPKPVEQQTSGDVTTDDVRRDAGQAVDTAVEYSKQSKEEFQQRLDARLKELDAETAKLRERGRDLKDQAKADWERKMAELETKRESTRAKLAELSKSSGEAWRDVQRGAQSAWDELEKSFRDAASEF
jgi:phytoene dehydrogenase-like protein